MRQTADPDLSTNKLVCPMSFLTDLWRMENDLSTSHYCPVNFELEQDHDWFVYNPWQTSMHWWIMWYSKLYNIWIFLFSFRRPTHLKEPYRLWPESLWFLNRLWYISQSSKMHVTHSNASDWHICKNKQDFPDFWAISYCFVHIVMSIRIQMHFVLLTTIALIFVWEGHFWIIFVGARAPKAPHPPTPTVEGGKVGLNTCRIALKPAFIWSKIQKL